MPTLAVTVWISLSSSKVWIILAWTDYCQCSDSDIVIKESPKTHQRDRCVLGRDQYRVTGKVSDVGHRLVELDLILSEDSVVVDDRERLPGDIDHTGADGSSSDVERKSRWNWRNHR